MRRLRFQRSKAENDRVATAAGLTVVPVTVRSNNESFDVSFPWGHLRNAYTWELSQAGAGRHFESGFAIGRTGWSVERRGYGLARSSRAIELCKGNTTYVLQQSRWMRSFLTVDGRRVAQFGLFRTFVDDLSADDAEAILLAIVYDMPGFVLGPFARILGIQGLLEWRP